MDEYLAISIASVWMTAALGFGVLLWIKRKEVPDRSRTILSLLSFAMVLSVPLYLFAPVFEHELTGQTTQLLSPQLCIGGLWGIFASLLFFYFELVTRLVPPAGKEPMQKADKTAAAPALSKGNLWPRICQVMDEWEEWRNPNTTVETVSHAIGTNRSYVGQAIREHTGLTFNDFMNQKRIEFMDSELRREPGQDQKTLYFEAGFRSRTAAYRNFVKFMGCSPTDYATGAGASAR